MEHHSTEKVTELAKERFFWFRMKKDIRHFISNTCSCVKEKKSNITKVVPLKAIPSASSMKLVATDFLNLGTYTGDISSY